ncbi:methyltransferase domain-containing protein [Brevibacillus ruminantium]|uniref:Methyltransferase domain-containing protein n=1 Tax=Brevibacillus ruminantium TaxID=2950604 RepID=A0ABY4W9R0_9BACL|nr:class I SAM-dependent methyltransferase [Brevibacillus ruminantium]USG63913.1 methyltransferase domain-containing protein [Brevibacillus ruminantium]
MAYGQMATVYDRLMADSPYPQWLDWAEGVWVKKGKPQRIMDLGCGTGSIAIPLAKRGYRVTGVDLSAEMLAVAYDKMRREQVSVTWVEQDMRELELPQADSIISFCDSLSYLTEEDDVQQTFSRVFAHLQPGGTFLFDVHSPYKVLHSFGDQTFTLTEDEISYIWQCFCDPLRMEVTHELTFFLELESGLYQRVEEVHEQRAYQPYEIVKWLREAGFVDVELTADFTDLPPHETSERLFFLARRP